MHSMPCTTATQAIYNSNRRIARIVPNLVDAQQGLGQVETILSWSKPGATVQILDK